LTTTDPLNRLWPSSDRSPRRRTSRDFDVLATDAFMLLLYQCTSARWTRSRWSRPGISAPEIDGQQAVEFARKAIEAAGCARRWTQSARPLDVRTRPRHPAQLSADPRRRRLAGLAAGRDAQARHERSTRVAVRNDSPSPATSSGSRSTSSPTTSRWPPRCAPSRTPSAKADAEVGPATLTELNVPVEARIARSRSTWSGPGTCCTRSADDDSSS